MGLFNSIKGLFNYSQVNQSTEHESTDYQSFSIIPAPVAEQGQYRVAGYIRKSIDDEQREHRFIRSDVCPSEQQAVELTISKCQTLIDQMGDKLFEQ
ncbi:HlyU family transcriptional regulator [Celerinatantimonas yamalensis]|uniref:HlyU family transcriptional regulator n=1 Tax=Celerinatantimonas yamalensis TaxID=559956 RepID=A0ABW9G3K0_9GAMM